MFRSVTEVVNFILYEICPRHLEKRKKKASSNEDSPVSCLSKVKVNIN